MSNPFKKITNDAETSKGKMYNHKERTETSVFSNCCESCGAPRPKNSNLVKCDYCKTPFMENVQNFKADL